MKNIASTALRQSLGFLSWWLTELREVLEDVRSHLAPRWRRSLTVYVARSHVKIVDGDVRSNPVTIEMPVAELGSSEAASSLSAAQSAVLASGRRARLVFDPQFAFIQPLHLPLATLPHLDSAIELQKPKLLPLEAAALRTDFEIVAVEQHSGTVKVELAAIKRGDIEPIEKAIEQWGLRLGSIHLGRADEDARLRFKFGASDARAGNYAMTRTDTLLAGCAVIFALCATGVFAIQSVRAQKSLERALAQTSNEATAVLQQRQQLISRLDTLSLVADSERAPTAAAILADVTTHLNHDSWLTTFELKGRDLRLVGLSIDPAVLVKDLGTSPLIGDVELRSSMSANNSSGKEKFEIVAQVRAPK
jgi:general secretion pathway protein L